MTYFFNDTFLRANRVPIFEFVNSEIYLWGRLLVLNLIDSIGEPAVIIQGRSHDVYLGRCLPLNSVCVGEYIERIARRNQGGGSWSAKWTKFDLWRH